ncbi:hypothetical protein KAU11_00640 [Candidatus Babeliales bacterium]|nr:hypothetical protein [Candidatus Babeliales bacterium]
MNKIFYVTSNSLKIKLVQEFFEQNKPNFEIEFKNIELMEPQTLCEQKVIKYKAKQAFEHLKAPLIVDDEGFYIKKYPCFPGTLSKHTVKGLGVKDFFTLADDGDEIEYYCNIAFVDKDGAVTVFRGSILGTCRKPEDLEKPYKNCLLTHAFIPTGYTKVLENLRSHNATNTLFPRNQALKNFLNRYIINLKN